MHCISFVLAVAGTPGVAYIRAFAGVGVSLLLAAMIFQAHGCC
jgi:hypothetical protein